MNMQNKSIDVSFIIPTKNSETTIKKCLEAITNQQTNLLHEIIIVDGGSSDKTIEIAKSYNVRIFVCDGFVSKARKFGVNAALGKYVAFVDSDVYISKNWLENIILTIKNFKIEGAIGKVVTGDSIMKKYSNISFPFSQDKRFWIRDCFPTVNTVILKERIIKVGNFDDSLTSSEDGDLTKRLLDNGFNFMFEPSAVCYHDYNASLKSMIKRDIWYTKGIFICMLRYGIKSWFFKVFTIKLLASIIFFIFLLLLLFIPEIIILSAVFFTLFLGSYSLIKCFQTKNKGWLIYLPMFIFNRISFIIASLSSIYFYIYIFSKNIKNK